MMTNIMNNIKAMQKTYNNWGKEATTITQLNTERTIYTNTNNEIPRCTKKDTGETMTEGKWNARKNTTNTQGEQIKCLQAHQYSISFITNASKPISIASS